jgi:hypothetical protein
MKAAPCPLTPARQSEAVAASIAGNLNMPDDADALPMGNKPEIEAMWDGVLAACRAGGCLAQQRDAGVWRELGEIARLFDTATAGHNDPEFAWSRFLQSKGVRRTRRHVRGKRPLFYGLIEYLSKEHASQEERSKSIISRRAAVLQRWHDHERSTVPADQVADWIGAKGGIKAIADIGKKPPMTKGERRAALTERQASVHRLVESPPLSKLDWDADAQPNLQPYANGGQRLALVEILQQKGGTAGVLKIIGMVDDRAVSPSWLNKYAPRIVERLPAARCEAAGDGSPFPDHSLPDAELDFARLAPIEVIGADLEDSEPKIARGDRMDT